MSDGHFNRSFLPHGDFASGVRVGKASERAICLEAFAEMLRELNPGLTEEQYEDARSRFKSLILSKEK